MIMYTMLLAQAEEESVSVDLGMEFSIFENKYDNSGRQFGIHVNSLS